MNSDTRVSIIIPVYNEAAHLPACLEAIAAQTVKPYEVIVVDNNSSDDSVAIARSYPFVRVIHEPRQGVVYARDAGFDAARGDIIGRIDADTHMAPDWVASVQCIFADERVDAVSGSVRYHDMPLAPLCNRVDLFFRRYLAYVLGDEVAMQGANMAFRRSVWPLVTDDLCRQGGMHEDLDLSIHINQRGFQVVFDESMVVTLGMRQLQSSLAGFSEYVLLSPKTYGFHGLKSRRHMYPVVGLAIVLYSPMHVMHQGFDPVTGRFSWRTLRLNTASEQRVNPATYVD